MTQYPTLEDLQAAALAVYHPPEPSGNIHAPEWEERYLGCSTLVKSTAAAYAKRIIGATLDPYDPHGAFWGFFGNIVAAGAIEPLTPYAEIRVWAPSCQCPEAAEDNAVGPTVCRACGAWPRVGHMDGLVRTDEGLVPVEHKCFGTSEDLAKNEWARRQCGEYAEMLQWGIDHGVTYFPTADFHDGEEGFAVQPGDRVAGIMLMIAPRFGPPAHVEIHPLSQPGLASYRDYYQRKAQSILRAVAAGDANIARDEWDRSPEGLVEFTHDLPEVLAGPRADAINTLSLEKHEADQQAKDATARKKKAEAEVLAALKAAGLEEARLPDGTIVRVNGGWAGAGTPWLRVLPPKKVEA